LGIADFYLPERALIIEADGDYWHKLDGVKEKDSLRDARFREIGIDTIRFSEKQINKEPHIVMQDIYSAITARNHN
jgi:very-short-patch-repair endonuclease